MLQIRVLLLVSLAHESEDSPPIDWLDDVDSYVTTELCFVKAEGEVILAQEVIDLAPAQLLVSPAYELNTPPPGNYLVVDNEAPDLASVVAYDIENYYIID